MASVTATIPPESKGSKVNIVCWLLAALSAAFLGLRLFCKFKTHRGLWWDDHVLIVSWVFLLISIAADSSMVPLGLGMHLSDVDSANLTQIGLLSNVASTFSMLAAVLSKTSFAVTLLRITNGYTKIFVWFAIVIMNIGMGLAALFVWVKCNPVRKTWDFAVPGTCLDSHAMMVYSVFAAALSAAMDLALAMLPWKVIWTLQMKTREKLGVAFAMSMGIFAAATAVVKCTKIPPLTGDNVATTIMASCIPVLRVLFQYMKSSVKQYNTSYEPSNGSHLKGTRANITTVTSPGNRETGSQVGKDDDTGSDKSILDRSVGGGNQIVQTTEFSVQFHNDGRGNNANQDTDSMGGYEMTNKGNTR
ncbi:hypothetical protein C8A05DRAFT_44827 [Staphylotrichum tortipilum]|uniref:Rhodopsin domain-containing protein n=1 Tax=Staphylotrichum tortipilum TaxID=2831512 RepID=A0AAN6MJQ7_9PEZI|nr:hypothetical protein C8A05DRAFT_44827 [Staphylotrichum longicolle]